MRDKPVTQGDLFDVRDELNGELREIRDELRQMESRMLREIGAAISHSTSVVEEHFTQLFGLLDEKYKDVPEKVIALRRDLDEHVSDGSLHAGSEASVSPRD